MQSELFAGRYQLQDPIGRGGMSSVYRALDLQTDRIVAIKVLRGTSSLDEQAIKSFVRRFQREAMMISTLQHPNIVQVHDYGQSDGKCYIVMELVNGTDLHHYLRSRGFLNVDRSVMIARGVALGLSAAHQRDSVHCDVKPQNILVGHDGSVKLTDFAIVMNLTNTGTMQYWTPEQAQGEMITPAADVYSLGIVMYEMLTGRTPFDGDNPTAVAVQHIHDQPVPPSRINPTIPPALEEIILHCLEKVPEMRFRDGTELARALETLSVN